MAMNRIQAARLLNHKEMALFETSLADRARELGDAQLQRNVKQLRTQRDKFQDLFRRQRVSTRERTGSKSGKSGVANERTRQKAEAFAQALARLEKLQERRAAAREREMRKSTDTVREAVRKAVKARQEQAPRMQARRARTGAEGSDASTIAPARSTRQRTQAMGQKRVLGHVASRGRRAQARRDAGG